MISFVSCSLLLYEVLFTAACSNTLAKNLSSFFVSIPLRSSIVVCLSLYHCPLKVVLRNRPLLYSIRASTNHSIYNYRQKNNDDT